MPCSSSRTRTEMPLGKRAGKSASGINSLTIRFTSSAPGRRSTAPLIAKIASGITSSPNSANCSGHMMPRVIRVRELDCGQHAAQEHLGAVLELGKLRRRVGRVGAEHRLVLGQRMAGEVKAEHLLLHGQAVLLGALG